MTSVAVNEPSDERDQLLDALNGILRERRYHDVTFVCANGHKVTANRALLAARNAYFEKLLYGDMREGRESSICVPHVSGPSLQLLVDYIYTCSSPLMKPDRVTLEAFMLADQYQMPALCEKIAECLREQATVGDLDDLITAGLELHAYGALRAVLHVFHRCQFSPSSVKQLSKQSLIYCLDNAMLPVPEETVIEAVLEWGGFNLKNLKSSHIPANDLLEVFDHVALDRIRPTYIANNLEPLKLLPQDLLLEVYRSQALRAVGPGPDSGSLPYETYVRGCWDTDAIGTSMSVHPDNLNRLECRSVGHQGARSVRYFTSGKHIWEVRVIEHCDYVWVGVVDETVDLNDWLGRQEGGWMMGNNDALCHNTQQGNGPYNIKCGIHGFRDRVWVYLDMDERIMSFSQTRDHSGSCVAFSKLPSKVYPAVSLMKNGCVELFFSD